MIARRANYQFALRKMSRNKYIFYIASVLVIVLVVAFASQVRKLQKQLPSSVRIIPSEPKSRKEIAQTGIEENASRDST